MEGKERKASPCTVEDGDQVDRQAWRDTRGLAREHDVVEGDQNAPHGEKAANRVEEIWGLFEGPQEVHDIYRCGFVVEAWSERHKSNELETEKHESDCAHSPARADSAYNAIKHDPWSEDQSALRTNAYQYRGKKVASFAARSCCPQELSG